MIRNVELYVKDIVEFMERAEEYIDGYSIEEFLNDKKTSDAVIRFIEVIGEASKNIPHTIRREFPSIPWRDMAGMRNKVIHSYFVVDFENVWLVVKEDIPIIKPKIKEVLDYVKPK